VAIVASQLTGVISITGADQSQKVLLNMADSTKKAQDQLNQLQNVSKDVGSILSNRLANDLKTAQGGLQNLSQRAESAGLDVSKFASLQQKASEAAAKLGLAQAQAADATAKANAITNDASASAEKIALAQARAAVSAENVQKAEVAASDAMAMMQGEATRLADALEASQAKGNLFSNAMAGIRERTTGFFGTIAEAPGKLMEATKQVGLFVFGAQQIVQTGEQMADAFIGLGKSAGDFQSGITSLSTGAGELNKNLGMVSDGILKMAPEVGESTKELEAGMFTIESSGQRGKDALEVLQNAAEGAKVGVSDLADVANGVTTALNDYGLSAKDSASVTNDLIATVSAGKTTMGDLASSLKDILPIASNAGVSLNGVTAALATMTGEGIPAGQAANYLKGAILALEAPSSQGAKTLASIGLSAQDVASEMKDSLPGALNLITEHLKTKFPEGSAAYTAALKDITGGSEALSAVIDLTGDHMKTFEGNVDNIYNAVKQGGTGIAGWSEVQKGFNAQLDRAKEGIEVFKIKLGTALFPVFTQVFGWISDKALPALDNFSNWFTNTAMPAVGQFGAFFHDNFGGLAPVIQDIARQFAKFEFNQWKTEMPLVKALFDDLGSVLNSIVIPAIQQFTMNIDKMLQWLNSASLPAQITRDLLLGIGVAITTIQIGAFVATIPALVAGFGAWAVSAGAAAVATIAATWPILAIGAAIAVVVAGIVLAVQHWGDIMGWITGKTEQTRIKVEQDHVKMRIAQDENTAQGAQAAINNYEKERQGILQKLKETHDPAEQAELQHQLKMTTAQEQGQMARLQKAEADKKKQLDKQKELHEQMVEAQKPWYQRMWDSITTFFGNVGKWFTDRFNDAKNGISGVFGSIGKWFGDRWHDVQNIFGGVGQWFHDRFEDAKNKIISVFYPIAKWFIERWNEIYAPIKPVVDYLGAVFETIGEIVHAIFGKIGAWFHDRFMEIAAVFVGIGIFFHDRFTDAWNAVVGVFQFLGKWFGDRWHEVQGVFAFVGGWFHDRWNDAWNAIVAVFTPIGKWFSDRWVDIQNIFRPVGNWFHDRFTDAWNGIVAVFSPVGKWFSDRWNDIMGGLNTFKTAIANKWNEIKSDATNIFKGIINGIIDQLNNGINAVVSFVNFFAQKLDDLDKSLTGKEGPIPMIQYKPIPHYASGTDAHPGGLAMVGERGRELTWLPKGAQVIPNNITEMLLGMLGGNVPGYADGIGDLGSKVMQWITGGAKGILDNLMNMFHISAPNLGGLTDIASGMFNKAKDWALDFINGILPKFSLGGQAVNIPGNVASWIAQAMAITGVPGSWLSPLEVIAMHESGGRADAVNNWDSNAQAGHPSQGLFQMIPSTFAAHALAGHLNILNPIDNAISAVRYIQGRYGDVFHVPGIVALNAGKPYVGYANGGIINERIEGIGLQTGTRYAFGENGKELVTPYVPSGVNLSSFSNSTSTPEIHIHNHHYHHLDGKQITGNVMTTATKTSRRSGPIRS